MKEEEFLFCDYVAGLKTLALVYDSYYENDERPVPRLVSPYRDQVYWYPERDQPENQENGWMRAARRHQIYADRDIKYIPVPEDDLPLDSGLWAYHDLYSLYDGEPRVRRHYDPNLEELYNAYTSLRFPKWHIVCVVRAYGNIFSYDNCFRAEYMRVEALCEGGREDRDLLYGVADEIGVEVIDISEAEEYMSELGVSLKDLPQVPPED